MDIFPNIAKLTISQFISSGTNIVEIRVIPPKTIQETNIVFLPQRFNVKSRNEYAGISTKPLITKFINAFPPKLFVDQLNP